MGLRHEINNRRLADWVSMARELDRFQIALKTPSPQFHTSLDADVVGAFATGVFSKVPIDKTHFEYPTGIVDLANDQVSIPHPGNWVFYAGAITLANPAIGNVWELVVWVNGAIPAEGGKLNSVQFHAANRVFLTGSTTVRVKKGDIVTARFMQNSGVAQTADGVIGDPYCFFKGFWDSP